MIGNTDIKRLLGSLRCSKCGNDFSENSFKIMREEDGLFVLQIKCEKCNKGFGMAFLGLEQDELLNSIKVGYTPEAKPNPINYDDILDAHKYIENLDENWKKFISKK